MWYSQTGNIGIGTSSPGDSLTVDGSMRIDSTTLYVDPSTNRVGIGTDTPTCNVGVGTTPPAEFNFQL